jgi:uncharacterized protein YqhQ
VNHMEYSLRKPNFLTSVVKFILNNFILNICPIILSEYFLTFKCIISLNAKTEICRLETLLLSALSVSYILNCPLNET